MKKRTTKVYKGPKYPTKAHGKIPAFKSIEEEVFFWGTHNMISLELMDLEDMSPFVRKKYLSLRKKRQIKKLQEKK